MSAALTLDGYPVLMGDAVTDVAFGVGYVTSVGATQFTVQFPSAVNQVYSAAGRSTTFSRRTLYWADPAEVVGPPPKSAGLRARLAAVVAPLRALIASLPESI